tara:strand:+ start:546 stop:803 length:258 start_codon:yes stop_codon:yes gene_type:complete
METLDQYSARQGFKTGQFASKRYILKDPEAREIFLKIAKEAEEKYISDTVAAQYLQKNFKQFKHLHYNTIRRYFRDYRSGDIPNE